MDTRGIIYVATRDDLFLEEAFVSAASVKQHNSVCEVALFTDRPDHPLCKLAVFDRIESVERDLVPRVDWSKGLLTKIRCLARSPYDHTLFLDTDTIVLTSELASLFELTDKSDVGMAEALADDSYSRKYFGRPLFNSGVIVYRNNALTTRWLREWLAISERNFAMAREVPLACPPGLEHITDQRVRRKLLGNDQISLVGLLSPETNRCGLKLVTLDYSWNHRGSRDPKRNRNPIRVRHWPRESPEIQAQLLRAAIHRTSLYAE